MARDLNPAAIIRDARKLAGLTQAELADVLGMLQPNVARLESGGRVPSLRVLTEILDACGCELRCRVVRAKGTNAEKPAS